MQKETSQQKLARVARELGAGMHRRVRGRWDSVRMAKRNLGDRHVWRFRTGPDEPDRFLLFSHRAMTDGANPTAMLLAQLDEARWLDRLQSGPATAFQLTRSGRLRARGAA